MKVYKVSTHAKPPVRGHDYYADLSTDDEWVCDPDLFLGAPYPKKWRVPNLYVRTPKRPVPSFYSFGGPFVISEEVLDLVGGALVDSGELLRVKIIDKKEKYYLYNCTNCMNVVDKKKSIFSPIGDFQRLEHPAFLATRFEDETLFKIEEDAGCNIYCLERTGEVEDGEFKALVDHHKLTGLEFELIWTKQKGLIPKKATRKRNA